MLRGKRREAESERSQAGGRGAHLPVPAPPPLQGLGTENNKKISTSLVMSPAVLTARSPLGALRALLLYSL